MSFMCIYLRTISFELQYSLNLKLRIIYDVKSKALAKRDPRLHTQI